MCTCGAASLKCMLMLTPHCCGMCTQAGSAGRRTASWSCSCRAPACSHLAPWPCQLRGVPFRASRTGGWWCAPLTARQPPATPHGSPRPGPCSSTSPCSSAFSAWQCAQARAAVHGRDCRAQGRVAASIHGRHCCRQCGHTAVVGEPGSVRGRPGVAPPYQQTAHAPYMQPVCMRYPFHTLPTLLPCPISSAC
jgi:hypothetical protein